jgi:hypothetical protein
MNKRLCFIKGLKICGNCVFAVYLEYLYVFTKAFVLMKRPLLCCKRSQAWKRNDWLPDIFREFYGTWNFDTFRHWHTIQSRFKPVHNLTPIHLKKNFRNQYIIQTTRSFKVSSFIPALDYNFLSRFLPLMWPVSTIPSWFMSVIRYGLKKAEDGSLWATILKEVLVKR